MVANYFRNLPTSKKQNITDQQNLVEISGETINSGSTENYIVEKGDTLWSIAENHYDSGYDWVKIAQENNIANPDGLEVGQELKLSDVNITDEVASDQVEDNMYTVVKGDTLWSISTITYGNGYMWTNIAHENNLSNPHLIHPGNVFMLPR